MKKLSKNKDYGYIIMHRDTFFNHSLYFAEPFSKGQALMDLHLLANHTDSCFDIRGIRIDVSKGEIARSVDSLATRWKWSKKKVVNFLKRLEKEDTILLEKSNIINKIKLKDYQKGITEEPTEEIQREQQRGYRRDTKEPHTINEGTNEGTNDVINDIKKEAIEVPAFVNLEIWNDFLDMRKLIKKPATDRAKTNLIKKLTDFYTEGIDPNECLNQSITNNWQDIFKPKNGGSNEKNLGNKYGGFNYTTGGGKPSISEAVERTLESIKNGSF